MSRPSSGKKSYGVKFWADPAEWEALQLRASSAGMSISAYLLQAEKGQVPVVETLRVEPKPEVTPAPKPLPYLGTRDMLHPLEGETLGQLNIRRALAGMRPLARINPE